MEEKSSWGIVIFLIVLFAVFWGGGFGFGNGRGWNNGPCGGFYGDGIGMGASSYGFQNYKATCDAEKTEIINTARTQYLTEQQAALTRETINAATNVTNTKIDFYAYQDLRDKLAESQRENLQLSNKLFVKEQLAPISAAIADVRCNMLPKPNVSGLGTSCNPIITPFWGFSNLNGFGCATSNVIG